MKHRITFSIMALGLALPVINLQAADDSRPQRGPRGERPGAAFMAALDPNKDGKLDKAEIAASPEALKKLDKDADGKLTAAELRGAPGRGGREAGDRPERAEGAERPERPNRQQSEANAGSRLALPPLLASLDTNKNGTIDADELAGAPAALLKLDKNGDGELSGDELQMGRGPRGPRGAAGDGGERPRRPNRGTDGAQNPPKP
jgi:Ca2+-binding EF-hand superfamily protein